MASGVFNVGGPSFPGGVRPIFPVHPASKPGERPPSPPLPRRDTVEISSEARRRYEQENPSPPPPESCNNTGTGTAVMTGGALLLMMVRASSLLARATPALGALFLTLEWTRLEEEQHRFRDDPRQVPVL